MFKYKILIYTYLMNTIGACNIHNKNTIISDILIANESNPEPFSFQEKPADIMDSSIKISVDPIKVFQKAGAKISDIVIENYNTLSTNMKLLDVKELHDLSPLQYPLFTEVKHENSSLFKSSIFICGAIGLILSMRYRKHDLKSDNCDRNDTCVISTATTQARTPTPPNTDSDEDIEKVQYNIQEDEPSRSMFSLWF
jgi:hypothetical protein